MTNQKNISAYISSLLVFSVMLLAFMPADAYAQKKSNATENDSIPLFRGFAIGVDLVGPIQMLIKDYGQYEASLRVNLKDKYFPVLEVGLGKADHTDDLTHLSYKTSAPFARVGMDFNILRNKHDIYRLYAGARYAFTSYKYDLSHPGIEDPVWGGNAEYYANDVKCSYHWLEFGIGIDVKMWGPVHFGWSARYKQRLTYDEGELEKSWYVPGFGESDGSAFGALFNVTIDI